MPSFSEEKESEDKGRVGEREGLEGEERGEDAIGM